MPKPHTFPALFDEALQMDISKLKQWGYLKPNQIKSGEITWSRQGHVTGEISIQVNTFGEQPIVVFNYYYRKEPRNYKVYLTSTPSNLGIGKVWYFLCPGTGKRCRKLYSIGGYFLHREAYNDCMYQSQTRSKKARQLDKYFGSYFQLDELYQELHSKHFKKFYAGKPTKRYLQLLEQIQQAERITASDIEMAMLS